MSLSWPILALAAACTSAVHSSAETPRRFEVDVPPNVESRATALVLRGLAVPRNMAVVVRAHAVASDSTRILLGTVALPGIAPDAEGMREIPELRMVATRGLRQWASKSRSARRVPVEVDVVTADSAGVPGPKWTLRAVELVQLE